MKNFLLSTALLIIGVSLTGCGSGSGISSGPEGNNPGVASVVQLVAGKSTVQTKTQVLFHATVLDGNGNSLKDEPVIFTNISPIGTLETPYSASAVIAAAGTTVVKTNSLGIATIAVFSSSEGFVTLRAEVDEAINQSRDSRTVYFASSDEWPPSFASPESIPGLELEVQGDGDYDNILLENPDDNIVEITATVTLSDDPQSNSLVTFGADVPWKNGEDGTCSSGSTCEVIFLFGNTAYTNSDGEASVFLKVIPTAERDIQTLFNVTASVDLDDPPDGIDAFNLVTLFIEPVVIETIEVTANPTSVELGANSTIAAYVRTSAGTFVPDGTAVSFAVTAGADHGFVEPFAQTKDGIAEVTFYADLEDFGTSTITATSGDVSDTVQVKVLMEVVEPPVVEPQPLEIFPPSASIATNASDNTLDFLISGGTPFYVSTSTNLFVACNDLFGNGLCGDPTDSAEWYNSSNIEVTIDFSNVGADTTVDINVFDTAGGTDTATITIFYVAPVCGNNVVQFGETCDDGNTTPLDGCDALCQTEP